MKKLLEIVGYYQKADPAATVTAKFVLVGIIWILFSDSLLFFLGPENIIWKLAHVHILKGLFFVGVTGGFLFYWTNRYVNSLQERETEVRSLFKSSPIAMGIIDAHTFSFLEVNDSLVMLFDLTGRELRGSSMADLAVEQERFEAVPLMIKTGARTLGTWKFLRSRKVISVDMSALPIRKKKAFLILFTDVTNQVRNERELIAMRTSLEREYDEKINHLHRIHEELAYRASQSEHVNAELIAVNEQLQHVNKKISLRAAESVWKNDQLDGIMMSMSEMCWSFDLTGRSKSFISPSAAEMIGAPAESMMKPWFWLDYVHPDDAAIKEQSQQQLVEKGYSASTYRIVSADGKVRPILIRLKLLHDPKGIPMIIGTAMDISDLAGELNKTPLSDSTARHV